MKRSLFLCLFPVLVPTSLNAFVQESRSTPDTKSAVSARQQSPNIFEPNNLVAWCIVPFDAANRTPAKRAMMLKGLGLTKVAYDWRAKHVASFEQEILEYKKHGLDYFAFWAEHDKAFELFRKHDLHPQIWQIVPSPKTGSQKQKVEAAGRQLLPLLKKVNAIGSKLGLYNHGGWGGEPDNMIAVCEWLRENGKTKDVGIVYNLHHAHNHITDFDTVLTKLKPHLLCLNINGMNDNAQPKIVALGQGEHDTRLMRIIQSSGYTGPIGILDHRPKLDAKQSLKENLAGLKTIKARLKRSP